MVGIGIGEERFGIERERVVGFVVEVEGEGRRVDLGSCRILLGNRRGKGRRGGRRRGCLVVEKLS